MIEDKKTARDILLKEVFDDINSISDVEITEDDITTEDIMEIHSCQYDKARDIMRKLVKHGKYKFVIRNHNGKKITPIQKV